jgi:hypothetical protein
MISVNNNQRTQKEPTYIFFSRIGFDLQLETTGGCLPLKNFIPFKP